MWIEKLLLKNFRRFNNLELEFKPGINVILGKNEAGKSTISNAISEVLFADPATKSKTFFQDNEPWKQAADIVLIAELADEENKYRLIKDFKKKVALFKNLNTQKELEGYKPVQLALSKLSGFPSRLAFENTAFVRQSDVTKIQTDNDFVSAIYSIAASGDVKVNVKTLIANLDQNNKELMVGMDRPAKNPGLLKMLTDKLTDLRKELAEKENRWKEVNEVSQESKENDLKLKSKNQRLDELDRLLKNNKLLKETELKLKDLDDKLINLESRLLSLDKLNQQKKLTQDKLKKYEAYENQDLEMIGQKMIHYDEFLKSNERQEQENTKKLRELSKEIEVVKPQPYIFIASLVVALVLGILIFLLFKNLVLGLGIILIVAPLSAFILIRFTRPKNKLSLLAQQLKEYEYHDQEYKKRQEATYKKSQEIRLQFDVQDTNDFFEKKREFLALKQKLKEVEAQMQGVLGEHLLSNLQKEQLVLLKTKRETEINIMTEEVKNANLHPEEYIRAVREFEDLQKEIRELQENQIASKIKVQDSNVSHNDLVVLREKIEIANSQYQNLVHKIRVNKIVGEVLAEAIESTANNAHKLVSREIEKYLPKLTKGRYQQARLTDELAVEIFSEEKKDWLAPANKLSRGTLDQIYFLLRMAFLRILVKDKTVPLILDDPFVTFDDERQEELKVILHELAKDRQILLFTCDPRYSKWGNLLQLS